MAPLKLIALDAPDVTILSAHLQDAVVKVDDMIYRPREKRFVLHANRIHRPAGRSSATSGERRRTALRIESVTGIKSIGFDPAARGTVLSILALMFAPEPDPARAPSGTLTIVGAGGASLRLAVECVEMVLEDLGPQWATQHLPQHEDS